MIDVKNNLDWAGVFMLMSERMRLCKSEAQMYTSLNNFKSEFNSYYGKLSRANKNKKGFDYEEK